MADAPATSLAPVSDSAKQSSDPVAATAAGDAPPKEPVSEAQTSTATEPSTSEVTKPLAVVPEVSKPADTPATDTNGATSAVNGTVDGAQSLVPEESKQASAPITDASTDKTEATEDPKEPAQPPVMAGAIQSGGQSEPDAAPVAPTESFEEDGVRDVPVTAAQAPGQGANGIDGKSSEKDAAASTEISPAVAADEKKDADMKDADPVEATTSTEPQDVDMEDPAPASASVLATASTPDGADASSASAVATAADGEEATGEKRKAENGTNGKAPSGEPAEKKQKGLADKVVTKAKEVVEEVKEKATPVRKNSKKGKRDLAPVGRTERKTRSQGRAE